jgi:putative ABC transport system substrate-binding protein
MRSTNFLKRIAVQSTVHCLAAAFLLLAGTVVAEAQQSVYRIGFVSPTAAVPEPSQLQAFRQGLRELGYVEQKNLIIETRFAENRTERLPELVAEVLRLKVDVLLAGSTPSALAAKRATTTVPIVFAGVLDPVGSGVVSSLARPGANITGVTVGVGGEGFTGKCLEFLRQAVPGLSNVAVLVNPSYPLTMQFRREVQAAAKDLSMTFDVRGAANANELEHALAAIGASRAQGVFVAPDPFLTASSARIARFATDRRLPALHFSKLFAEAGGLMSYGGTLAESYRRAATHVHKILNGAKPADLPIEQPTKFELVINLKTATALGLTMPQPLLLQAAEVIK